MTPRKSWLPLVFLLASLLGIATAEDRDVWLFFYPAPAAGVDKFYAENEYIMWTAHPDNQGGQTAGSICGASTPEEIPAKEKDNAVDGTLSKPCANAVARLRKEYWEKYLKEDGVAREYRLKGYLDKLLQENKLGQNNLRRDNESDRGWYFPPQDERRGVFENKWVEMGGYNAGSFPVSVKSEDGIKFILTDLDRQPQDFKITWNPPASCRPIAVRGNAGGDHSDAENWASVKIPSMLDASGASSALIHMACTNPGLNPDGTKQERWQVPRLWVDHAVKGNLIADSAKDLYIQPGIVIEAVSSGEFARQKERVGQELRRTGGRIKRAQQSNLP